MDTLPHDILALVFSPLERSDLWSLMRVARAFLVPCKVGVSTMLRNKIADQMTARSVLTDDDRNEWTEVSIPFLNFTDLKIRYGNDVYEVNRSLPYDEARMMYLWVCTGSILRYSLFEWMEDGKSIADRERATYVRQGGMWVPST
jgi:hypothetical protein